MFTVVRMSQISTDTTTVLPPVLDRVEWQARIDELRVREKAHTREGDAIAASRRRLPMVEVDPITPLTGATGPTPLLDCDVGRPPDEGRPAGRQADEPPVRVCSASAGR
jgi:hypothetical protein